MIIDTTLTPELIEEGNVREIISKVQTMRKEAGFEVTDKIELYAKGNDKITAVMENNEDRILSEVLAQGCSTVSPRAMKGMEHQRGKGHAGREKA